MRLALAAAAVLCLAGTATADPADDATEADIRCVVVATQLANADSAAMKLAATVSSMYFLGRIDARAPDIDLEAHITDAINKMTPEEMRAEGLRCGQILSARGAALKSMGEDMIRKGEGEAVKKSEKGA